MLKIKNPRQKGQTETVCNMIIADVYKDIFTTRYEFYNECNISELRKRYTIGCDPIGNTKDTSHSTVFKMNENGIVEYYKDLPIQKESGLTYEKLKEYLEIFNRPLLDSSAFKLGMLSYEEISRITNITEEEYENSTKAYWIGNAITGLKGYSDFLEMLKQKSQFYVEDLDNDSKSNIDLLYDKNLLNDFRKL